MKKLAYIVNNSAGVCYHRLQVPFLNLVDTELDITETNGFVDNNNPNIKIKVTDFDIIVFNRWHIQPELIYEAKKAGVKIIVDIDDFWHLPEHHVLYKDWNNHEMPSKVISMIKLADMVWTTNAYLAGKISRHNRNIVIVPNAIDFNQDQFKPCHVDRPQKFNIGWAGSVAHNKDIQLMEASIRRIHADETLKDKYCMVMGGYSLDDQYQYWQKFEHVFDDKSQPGSYLRIMKADVYNYAVMYNFMDVALAPLVDDMFNNCKSNLKLLEAGALSVPLIASYTEPYRELLFNTDCGFLVNNNKHDWYKHMSWCIRNPEEVKQMGKNLHEYVKENYNIARVNDIRRQALNAL